MSTVIAGVEIPETAVARAATRFAREHTSPLMFDHSRRVYLFGSLRADALGWKPDHELLYVASMMHDTGLFTPFSDIEQRFELDGADHARRLLLEHGFEQADAEIVWTAIALHTTPAIPGRMRPEVAVTNLGVLVDALGLSLDELDIDRVAEITAPTREGISRTASSRRSSTVWLTGRTPRMARSTLTCWNASSPGSSAGAWSTGS